MVIKDETREKIEITLLLVWVAISIGILFFYREPHHGPSYEEWRNQQVQDGIDSLNDAY